ncbi:MAG TPA: hypothetical protein VGO50_17910 [Pyrinomonadaceae bacterium]|nr:hypothetical protein [Pyrinomonadaceae bacterium]
MLISAINISAQNDFKMRQRMTVAGRTMESAVMIKGARERTESDNMGMKSVSIMQCDLKRTIRVSEPERKYLIEPMAVSETAAPAQPVKSTTTAKIKTQKGGIVTRTLEIIDTGERQQMFGMTARHIKTVMTTEASPDACDKNNQRIETDGWYVDLSVGLSCKFDRPVENPMNYEKHAPACLDQAKFIQKGTGKLGYALKLTTKISMSDTGGDDDPETAAMMAKMGMGGGMMTMTTEVTELSRATLPAELFDIPVGYAEAKEQKELYGKNTQKSMGEYQKTPEAKAEMNQMMQGMPAPGSNAGAKKSGMVRVGVMTVSNSTGKPLATDMYQNMLVSQINGNKLEAVAITSADDAKRLNCDYILSTDIKSLKQSAASKVGGLFGKVTGAGSGEGKVEVAIGYDLKPLDPDGTTLQMQSTTAKIEGQENSVMSALGNEAQAVVKALKK